MLNIDVIYNLNHSVKSYKHQVFHIVSSYRYRTMLKILLHLELTLKYIYEKYSVTIHSIMYCIIELK